MVVLSATDASASTTTGGFLMGNGWMHAAVGLIKKNLDPAISTSSSPGVKHPGGHAGGSTS